MYQGIHPRTKYIYINDTPIATERTPKNEGSNGELYTGYHEKRKIVIKIYNKYPAAFSLQQLKEEKKYIEEANRGTSIDLSILRVVENNGEACLIMPWVNDKTLYSQLEKLTDIAKALLWYESPEQANQEQFKRYIECFKKEAQEVKNVVLTAIDKLTNLSGIPLDPGPANIIIQDNGELFFIDDHLHDKNKRIPDSSHNEDDPKNNVWSYTRTNRASMLKPTTEHTLVTMIIYLLNNIVLLHKANYKLDSKPTINLQRLLFKFRKKSHTIELAKTFIELYFDRYQAHILQLNLDNFSADKPKNETVQNLNQYATIQGALGILEQQDEIRAYINTLILGIEEDHTPAHSTKAKRPGRKSTDDFEVRYTHHKGLNILNTQQNKTQAETNKTTQGIEENHTQTRQEAAKHSDMDGAYSQMNAK